MIEEKAPLFPGYIFVLISESWSKIKNTKGIANVVMTGAFPSMMRSCEIDTIKSLEVNGYVVLPERAGEFKPGDKVRSMYLPDNVIGIYQGDSKGERTRVLFDMLGRSTSVYIHEKDLVAVA